MGVDDDGSYDEDMVITMMMAVLMNVMAVVTMKRWR